MTGENTKKISYELKMKLKDGVYLLDELKNENLTSDPNYLSARSFLANIKQDTINFMRDVSRKAKGKTLVTKIVVEMDEVKGGSE